VSRKVVLGIVVGGLILAGIVSGSLRISRGEELPPMRQLLIQLFLGRPLYLRSQKWRATK
jgi:hypothetical protein